MKSKRALSCFLVLVVLTAWAATGVWAQELLTNGGFETDVTTGWTLYGSITRSRQTAWPYCGSGYMYTAASANSATGGVYQTISGLTNGATYLISGAIRSGHTDSTATVKVDTNGDTSYNAAEQTIYTGITSTTAYSVFSAEVTATGTSMTVFLNISVGSSGNGHVVSWDCLTVKAIPGAPTVAQVNSTTLSVTNNSLDSSTGYFAFRINGGAYDNQYVQADGTVGANPVWQTKATWGTKNVTGLTAGTAYTFDVAQASDSSGTASTLNYHPAVYTGTQTKSVANKWGSGNTAISQTASSSNYINLAGVQNGWSNFAGGITIELWANPSSVAGCGFVSMASLAGSSTDCIDFITNSGTPGLLQCNYRQNTTQNAIYTNSAVVTTGSWQHLAVTIDAAGAPNLYKNGVVQTVTRTYANLTLRDVPRSVAAIGKTVSNLTFTYGGSIDEVAIYDYALSASQLLAHYNAASAIAYNSLVVKDAPVAYYRLGESSGTAAADSKGGFGAGTTQTTSTCTPPNAPTSGTATAGSTSTITWGWTRASGATGETYRAFDASTGGTQKWESTSQATSYVETGLSTNTLYGTGAATGNQRHLATYLGCESATRLALPAKYTLQANATTPTFGTTTTSSIVLNTTGPVNLTAGSSGVIFKRNATTDLTKVQALTTTDSGLTANTSYSYTARGVNGDNAASTESSSASKYTLAIPPTYDDSSPYGDVTLRCDAGQSKTNCTAGQNITFTFNNAFGAGAANVGQFGYLWDQNSGDPASWTGEQYWTSGATLVKQAGAANTSYYLHIRSYNNDSTKVANTTVLNLGPYSVPGAVPNAPGAAAATGIGTNGITWHWTDASNNEDGFRVYDAASSGNMLYDSAAAGVTQWAESSLENDTSYSRWVSAYNENGESTRTALSAVSTTIPDCIQNTDMEGTFISGRAANWKAFGSPTLASSTTAHGGTYSQRSTVADTSHRGIYQKFNVVQGYWYNVWAWLNVDATSTTTQIALDPDPSTVDETYGKQYSTVGWGRRDVQQSYPNGIQATGTTMAVVITAFKNQVGTTGYGYIDDVQLSPGITQPSNASLCAGMTTTFSITATGTGNTYQWQKNTGSGWTDITAGDGTGYNTSTYTTPTLTNGMNGYQYRCVVTGASGSCGGSINSQAALLTVYPTLSAPTDGTPTTASMSAITWKWADLTGETGYRVKDAGGTNKSGDLAANTVAWEETGLAANTQYTRKIYGVNSCGEGDGSTGQSLYTWIEKPTGISFGSISDTSIEAGPSGTLTNIASGSSGVYTEIPGGANSGWLQTTNPASFTSLTPNTRYTFRSKARNGDAVERPGTGISGTYLGNITLGAADKWTGDSDSTAISGTGNASDYVDIGDTGFDSFPNGITIEAWLNVNSTSQKNCIVDISPDPSGNTGKYLQFHARDTNWLQAIWRDSNSAQQSIGYNSMTTGWHHVALTIPSGTGVTARLYLDGAQVQTATVNGVPDATRTYNAIGFSFNNADYALKGSIDEVAIYDKVLGASELSAHYGAASSSAYASAVTASDPLAYFRLDETSGTTAQNLVGPWSPAGNAYTLAPAPVAGSVTTTSSAPCPGDHVLWTNNLGFGAGAVQYFKYVWDQNATWDGTGGTTWSGGQLDTEVAASGTWYLHVKSYNAADAANGVYHYSIATGSVPSTPSDGSPTGDSTSSITWKWSDVSGESGYRVKDLSGTSKSGDLAANLTEWQETTGISANTQYSRRVFAFSACGESSGSTGQSKYSLIQTPTGVSFSNITETTIDASPLGTLSNLTSGNSGVKVSNTTANNDSGWMTTNAGYTSTALTANTQYTFVARARNGDGVQTDDCDGATAWTLALAPTSTNITPSATSICSGDSVTWSTSLTFGGGGVQYFRYAWDKNSTHTWDDTETQWTSTSEGDGTIVTSPTSNGDWYLHVKSYNGADAGNATTLDYLITTSSPPSAPTAGTPTGDSDTQITWKWSTVSGAAGYRVKDTNGEQKGTDLGSSAVEWTESGLQPNTEYTRRIYAFTACGESAGSSEETKRTLAAAPTLGVNVSSTATAGEWYGATKWDGKITNPQGFGTSGKVSKFKYAWSKDQTYSWTGSESDWTGGSLAAVPSSEGDGWYLYLRSYNADNIGSGSLQLGPYKFDFTPPTAAAAFSTSFSGATATINFGTGTDTLSGIDSGEGAAPYKVTGGNRPSTWFAGSTATDTPTANAGDTVTYTVVTRDKADNQASVNITARKPIDASNKWIYTTTGTTLAPPGVWPVSPSKVFAGSGDYKIHAIGSSAGAQLWQPLGAADAIQGRVPVASVSGTPYVLAASEDTYVYKINANTGSISSPGWKVSLDTEPGDTGNKVHAKVAGQFNVATPGGTKDLAFVGTCRSGDHTGNFLRALNLADGSTVWTFRPNNLDVIMGDPGVSGTRNTVYFTSLAGSNESQPSVWAVNSTNGELIWSASPGDVASTCSLNAAGTTLYVGTTSTATGGTLCAYRTVDEGENLKGSLRWSRTLDAGYAIYGAPYPYNGKVYVATTAGKLWCINDDGNSSSINTSWGNGNGWVSVSSPSQPLVMQNLNKIYVGSSDGYLYQLSMTDGSSTYPKHIGYTVGDCAIDVSTSYIYCGTTDGRIYAFQIPFTQ